MWPETPDENGKTQRADDFVLKKIKKKKKKKHREDMRGRRLKMYNKEVQTICAGLTRISKEILTQGQINSTSGVNKESFRYLKDEQLCRLNLGMQEYRVPQGVQTPFMTHQEHSIRRNFLKTGTKFSNFIHEEHSPMVVLLSFTLTWMNSHFCLQWRWRDFLRSFLL